MAFSIDGVGVPNLESFIENSKVKSEFEFPFKNAIFELRKIISRSSNYEQVTEVKFALEELRGRISEESRENQTIVSIIIDVAVARLHNLKSTCALKIDEQKRTAALQNIPDKVVSFEGVDPSVVRGIPFFILEDDDAPYIPRYSLKKICENSRLTVDQLPGSIEISERLVESLKDKSKVLGLIQFCSNDPLKVQSLFSIMHYLSLDDFQNVHLEPFNKIFPNIALDQAPLTISQLDLSDRNVEGLDFSKFKFLKS
jgi:hypothetical protein